MTSASWDQGTNTASGPTLTTAPDLSAQYPADPAATAVLTLSNATGGTSVTLPIDSYKFGFHNTGTIGSDTGKATFNALDVTLPLSNGSPALLTALTERRPLPAGDANPEDARVRQVGGHRLCLGVQPGLRHRRRGHRLRRRGAEESVSFAFGAAAQKYVPQNPDGTLGTPVITGWSYVNNSSSSSDIPTTFDLTVAPAPLSAARPR